MTKKALLGLTLVAMSQLDIYWLPEVDLVHAADRKGVFIATAKIGYTIDRHSIALNFLLEAIVDSPLGKGLTWE